MVKERQGWLRTQLNWPKRFLTNSTYSEALARCDAQQIATVIASVLLKPEPWSSVGANQAECRHNARKKRVSHVARVGKPPEKWFACVHGDGGYHLTIMKKNQPQMYQDLVDFFDDPDAEQEEWQ